MANFEIPENPKFTEEVRKFEEEDPGHADLFNAVVETLLGNEVFLKKLADSLARRISGLNTLTKYTTAIGSEIIQKESGNFDLDGNTAPFPIQEVVAGHEKAINQLNTETRQSTNGKFTLPDGLMVQWGVVDYSGSLKTTFPTPYKQIPHVSVSPYYQTDASVVSATLLRSVDKNGFTTKNFYAIAGELQPWTENKEYTSGYSWIAVGY